MNASKIKHIGFRVFILFVSLMVSIPLGLAMLNPNRRCGTGDGLAIAFWMFVFYVIWSLALAVESFLCHKKNEVYKRNSNIVMILALPTLFFLLWLYLTIADLF
jgi:hypothetical protein